MAENYSAHLWNNQDFKTGGVAKHTCKVLLWLTAAGTKSFYHLAENYSAHPWNNQDGSRPVKSRTFWTVTVHGIAIYISQIPCSTTSPNYSKQIESEMDNLFFPTRRAYSPRPILRSAPTQTAPKSKVISIPVHSADDKHRSPEPDRSSAAVKIQKNFRGFLVRKNMQNVKKIAAEAVEIGRQISAIKIRDDAKERLRIGEILMALLLRLDAVRGVREYRKKVIRQVIQLQEAVDSIAQGETPDSDENKEIDDTVIPAVDGDGEYQVMDDSLIATEEIEVVEPQKEDSMVEEVLKVAQGETPDSDENKATADDGGDQVMDDSLIATEEIEVVERQKGDSMVEEVLKEGDEEIDGESWGIEESIEAPAMAGLTPVGGDEMIGWIKEAMAKASAETEALRRMLGELCERSAQQCELMSGLVQRVDELERRLQRMERRRKKH